MKKTSFVKILVFLAVIAALAGCKSASNGNTGNCSDASDNEDVTGQPVAKQPEVRQIDTLAVYNAIDAKLKSLSENQLWDKEIFTPDYYAVCQKLCEFSDGDAFWGLGSAQEVVSVSATDFSDFKLLDSAHVMLEAALYCKDIASHSGLDGTEFRILSMVLKDGTWLIDDVNNSKQEMKQAVRDYEAGAK